MDVLTKTNDAASVFLNVVMKEGLDRDDSKSSTCTGGPNNLNIDNRPSDCELRKVKTGKIATNVIDDDDAKEKEDFPQKRVHFDQSLDWEKEEEKHRRGHRTRQERLRIHKQKKKRRKRSKKLAKKKRHQLWRRPSCFSFVQQRSVSDFS